MKVKRFRSVKVDGDCGRLEETTIEHGGLLVVENPQCLSLFVHFCVEHRSVDSTVAIAGTKR